MPTDAKLAPPSVTVAAAGVVWPCVPRKLCAVMRPASTLAGSCTRAEASRMVSVQPLPVTFQYSSSCVSKKPSWRAVRYRIS
jgi:hypothetical protein